MQINVVFGGVGVVFTWMSARCSSCALDFWRLISTAACSSALCSCSHRFSMLRHRSQPASFTSSSRAVACETHTHARRL
jgi:hypothetical protein